MTLSKELLEDNQYIIYSDGRLYSEKIGGFLKGMIDSSGYHCYLVRINGKSKFLRTNRLVAEYFVENPNNLEIVNHKDKNKLNNDYRNLEWVSYSDNIKDYYLKTPERKISKAIYVEKLDNEIWVDIKDFDRYQVSNLGRIKVKATNRLMKEDSGHKYSRMILLNNKNKRIHILVHRLVYCNFYQDFDLDGYVIDHIDANPKNNALSNLQKITPSENSKRQKRFQK